MNKAFLFLCCILLLSVSLWLGAAPAQAKWWQIFHRHKTDATDQTQSLPPPAPASSTYSSLSPSSPLVPAVSTPLLPGNRGRNSVAPTSQAVMPALEPPPLPDRPPIPDPPQVACPAPLGSGIPKPALAWRAKSLRQLNLGGASNLSSNTPLLASTPGLASAKSGSIIRGADSGISLSKTFAAKFDDTFMAAVLAMGQSGLNVRSMDSTHGRLEGISSDPRLRFSVSLQLNRDLLDTTSVSCYCAAANTPSKVLIADVLSNINECLGTQINPRGTKVTSILNMEQSTEQYK